MALGVLGAGSVLFDDNATKLARMAEIARGTESIDGLWVALVECASVLLHDLQTVDGLEARRVRR